MYRSVLYAASLVAGIVFAAAAHAASPPIYPVEAYAKLPFAFSPKLSPNGKFIAYITAAFDGRKSVISHPITGLEKGKTMFLPHSNGADVSSVRWANDDVLLVTYTYYGTNDLYRSKRLEQSRLVAASLKNGGSYNIVKVSKEEKKKLSDPNDRKPIKTSFLANQAYIVDLLHDDPKHILLMVDDDIDGDFDIRKIDVDTGKYTLVQKGRRDIYEWVTDENHQPSLGYSLYDEKPKLYIIPEKSTIWSYEAIYGLLEKEFVPLEVSRDGTSALFAATNTFGRQSLGLFDLTDGKLIEWVYSNPKYDVAGEYRSDITGRINGTGYYDTAFRQVFLSGIEKDVLAFMNIKYPGAINVILSSDKAGRLWMISSQTPQETPKYYTLDWKAKQVSLFIDRRADIEDTDIAQVTMHTVTMRDGLDIEVYVTTPIGAGSKQLPTILLPHGGPWARDSMDFDIWAQFFANRGYLVLQPNFRGSSGYGTEFEDLGDQAWGGAMQDDITDTAAWAIEKRLTDKDRVCIVGGSYGGYAALMGVVKTPDLFQCAISINGVADMPMFWTQERGFLWYKRIREVIAEDRGDLKDISPYHRAAEIKKPVLLIAAKDDSRLSYKHSKKMYRKLKSQGKRVEYLQLKTGGHSVDVDAERMLWFKAMDDFLAEHLP